MKKVLAILMLSFLVGFTLESCTNETEDELQIMEQASEPGDDGTIDPTDPDDDGEG